MKFTSFENAYVQPCVLKRGGRVDLLCGLLFVPQPNGIALHVCGRLSELAWRAQSSMQRCVLLGGEQNWSHVRAVRMVFFWTCCAANRVARLVASLLKWFLFWARAVSRRSDVLSKVR